MPLNKKGKEIMKSMKKTYGKEAEAVFYASKNKVERAYMSDYDWLKERRDLINWFFEFLNKKEQEYINSSNFS